GPKGTGRSGVLTSLLREADAQPDESAHDEGNRADPLAVTGAGEVEGMAVRRPPAHEGFASLVQRIVKPVRLERTFSARLFPFAVARVYRQWPLAGCLDLHS